MQIEAHHQRLALRRPKGSVRCARQARRLLALDAHVADPFPDTVFQALLQLPLALALRCQVAAGDDASCAQCGDARNIFGAGAPPALLVAAVQQRLQRRGGAFVPAADPLRRVNLVSGKRQKIDAEVVHRKGHLAQCLHRVGVHQGAAFVGRGGNVGDGLQRADLVVGQHDGNQNRLVRQAVAHRLRVHDAAFVHRHVGNFVTLPFEGAAGVQDGRMLDLRRDQVAPAFPVCLRHPLDNGVVGLGAAAAEDDRRGGRAQHFRHRVAGVVDGHARPPAVPVHTRRVAERLALKRQHRIQYLREHRRRGVVVHVHVSHVVGGAAQASSSSCRVPTWVVTQRPRASTL